MLPNVGPLELIIILVIVLVIFGAGKLPQAGVSLGKAIKGFQDAIKGKSEDSADKKEKDTTKDQD
jgi:sec-independent protein translocase protein TatA